MIALVSDGLAVLLEYWYAILVVFVALMGLGLFTARQMGLMKDELLVTGFISFGIGAGVLSLAAFLLTALAYFVPGVRIPGAYLILFISGFLLIREALKNRRSVNWRALSFVVIALFLYLAARLAFLNYILVPPHSDSPVHYQIISDLTDSEASRSSGLAFGNIFQRYYHYGFHSLAAWLVTLTHIPIGDAISLLGQVFLFIVPLSMFALAYSLTKNTMAGSLVALFAAVGWAMPAFAVNWGKFPALSSLAVAPAIIAAIFSLKNTERRNLRAIIWFALLSLAVSLLHSRMAILLVLGLLAFFLIERIDLTEKLTLFQSARIAALSAVSLLPHYGILRDFYGSILILLALVILLPFAIREYPRTSIGLVLFTFLLWIALIGRISIGGRAQVLLDEQFVAMTLFIPLSLIAGLGLAGLVRTFRAEPRVQRTLTAIIVALFAISIQPGTFYPDPCCNFFTVDDDHAIQWIQEHTPTESLFLISAAQSGFQRIGTDAGIWVTPLAQRPANKIPYDTNWSSVEEDNICKTEAPNIYIYSGGREFSFLPAELSDSEWLRNVFGFGKIAIYEVTGC